MLDLVDAILTVPGAIATALLGVVCIYWVLVIAGALDLDILNGPPADGAAGSGADAGLERLGLAGVPIMIPTSILVLASWVLVLFGVSLVGGSSAPWWAAAAVSLGAVCVALPVVAIAVRPLRRLFLPRGATAHRQLVGKVCTVRTLRVDSKFGQAEVDDGAAGLLVQVRCDDENDLTRGSRALIFHYNDTDGVFHVARFDDEAPDDSFASRS